MLYYLAQWLAHYYSGFHVFYYVSFRAILAALTALGFSIWFGPGMIKLLSNMQLGQVVRTEGPKSHLSKSGTPTMGGAMILLSILLSVLLWANLANPDVWVVLIALFAFGVIGWIDDYKKIVKKNADGLIPRWKFFWQSVIGILIAVYLFCSASIPQQTELFIPFLKHVALTLGPVFLLITYLMIVGFSNAVNLTDGLDGLAIFPVVLVSGGLAVFAYVTGNLHMAHYLYIPYIPGVGELAVLCAGMVGAGLGFLWFNAYPADVFMGDVGSLGLGAALGTMAVIVRQEIVFCIMGGIFILETVSVVVQVASYKTRKKRIFRMAPIHHHFELKGWPEPRVIVRFWIITFILVLIGLATLKIR